MLWYPVTVLGSKFVLRSISLSLLLLSFQDWRRERKKKIKSKLELPFSLTQIVVAGTSGHLRTSVWSSLLDPSFFLSDFRSWDVLHSICLHNHFMPPCSLLWINTACYSWINHSYVTFLEEWWIEVFLAVVWLGFLCQAESQLTPRTPLVQTLFHSHLLSFSWRFSTVFNVRDYLPQILFIHLFPMQGSPFCEFSSGKQMSRLLLISTHGCRLACWVS